MMILPSASHHVPMNGIDLPKKREARLITAWGALIWAYANENVRAANGHLMKPSEGRGSLDISPRGSINGLWACDADAVAIDAFVGKGLGNGAHYVAVAQAAEDRVPLKPVADVEIGRFYPDTRHGSYHLLDPRTRRPVACKLRFDGLSADAVAAAHHKARLLYDVFAALLTRMDGERFGRWTIYGAGA